MRKVHFTGIVLLLMVMLPLHAIGSNMGKDPLSIYPNPASEILTIKFESGSAEMPDVRILDLTGKEVLKIEKQLIYENSVYQTSVDISSLKAGIYFVKVVQAKKVYTMKLMVE
jgi:hypothetical protein